MVRNKNQNSVLFAEDPLAPVGVMELEKEKVIMSQNTFEKALAMSEEMNMLEILCEKIGDLTPNMDVELDALAERQLRDVQFLYRFMVENPELEIHCLDELAIYFKYTMKCGHELMMPWLTLADEVSQMIVDNSVRQSCLECSPEKEEKPVEKNQEKKITLADLQNVKELQVVLLQPMPEKKMTKRQIAQANSLFLRCKVRLNALKKAVEDENLSQAVNAGKALKAGLVFGREKMKLHIAVKNSPPEGSC